MPHRYSFGPRDGTVASFCGFVVLNTLITNPDSLLGRLPPGEERVSEFKNAFEEHREWSDILMKSPGFNEFVAWINIELKLDAYDTGGGKRARHELAERLHLPFHEIDKMSLADAAEVLNRPAKPGKPDRPDDVHGSKAKVMRFLGRSESTKPEVLGREMERGAIFYDVTDGHYRLWIIDE